MSVTLFRGGGLTDRSPHQPISLASSERERLERAVASSMDALLGLLSSSVGSNTDDEAMIELGATSDMFIEPLTKHEVQVLACALYMDKQMLPLAYGDILRLTDRFSGKAMNITMVYKTIERLVDRGLLALDESRDGGSNKFRIYKIHGSGREAFKLAVLNSRLLAGSKSPAAA